MTREEVIEQLQDAKDGYKEYLSNDALDMAIKALEHPEKNVVAVVPCGDCISREQVLKQVDKWKDDEFIRVTNPLYYLKKRLNELPSVTPQEPKIVSIAEIKYDKDKLKELMNKAVLTVTPQEPKTGHWITTRTLMHDGEFYCDKCKCDAPNNEKWDYCPNCGAKMVEPTRKQG